MYLDEFQKTLVTKLNQNGDTGILSVISEMLISQEANLTKRSFAKSSGTSTLYVYKFKAKNQETKFYKISNLLFDAYDWKYEPANSIDNKLVKKVDDNIQIRKKHDDHYKIEIKDQIKFLRGFQGKIQESLHLIEILVKNNLVISYEESVDSGFFIGNSLDDCNYWIDEYNIYEKMNQSINELFLCVDKILRTRLVILPGLNEFEKNNYFTLKEIANKNEIFHLKTQTTLIALGVLVSAVITLMTVCFSHPNASDIKAITESINELTVKVDELTPKILQPSQLERSIMTDTDLGPIIEPVISMQ